MSKAHKLLIIGIITIIAGFVYDSLAGIPYQDPTPAMLGSYTFHAQVASVIRWSGLSILLTGISLLALPKRSKK